MSSSTARTAVEANGKTILENSLITISTESGDGRHNDVKRELSGVFHAITGANGRFKTGQIMDVGAEGTRRLQHDARPRWAPSGGWVQQIANAAPSIKSEPSAPSHNHCWLSAGTMKCWLRC